MTFRFRRPRRYGLSLVLALGAIAPQAQAQQRPPRPTDVPGQAPAPAATAQPPKPTPPPDPKKLKDYEAVVTKEAKTQQGFITVHRIEDRILFEIPNEILGRDLLWMAEAAQVPAGTSYGGSSLGNVVVRFQRRNNTVYMRLVNYDLRAESGAGIQRAVRDASVEPIIAAFNVETENKAKNPVIDVTRIYLGAAPELNIQGRLGGGIDPTRSYLDRLKAYPTNINVRSVLTLSGLPGRGASAATATIHYSLNLLPEKPMMGRLYDSRVGYFTEDFMDAGRKENRIENLSYIARYRLEKKDPKAAVSEPVKPIVYYISREVPEEWRSYVKKGVEDWQVAFEAAGFKNAIICKMAPTEAEDPDWDPEDARYSVIRWAPNPIGNAMGPHVHDPRSGEIINAHIIVWHDILKLQEAWYFSQVAPLDKRAQKFPFPQELSGELLRYVVAHEVGHTLGLRHNHRASSAYTVAQLRSKEFTEKYGNEASIMDYGRFNYVAQPGDNARLIPLVAPYDLFAIEWGYKPIYGAKTSHDEKGELDAIAARQVTNPHLRFGSRENASVIQPDDPTVQIEDLSSDGIEAGKLGAKNLERVAQLLIPASTKHGEDYSRLSEAFGEMMGQRRWELMHVVSIIGGVVETDYHAGRGGDVYRHVPRERQKKAMEFLQEYGFKTPTKLLLPQVLNKIEASGVASRVQGINNIILTFLLSPQRIQRLVDGQALNGKNAYSVSEMVGDLQSGIWSELKTATPQIDIYRRNLQRLYIQKAQPIFATDATAPSEFRAALRGALKGLLASIDKSLPRVQDKDTALHLSDSRAAIDLILNPKR